MHLPKQQPEFQELISLSRLSFALCVWWQDNTGHTALRFSFQSSRGEELLCAQVLEVPRAWPAGRLCQLHYGLVFSGLFLIIVQQLMCLKEGIDFEITPAPFLPCVSLGAWQKGSCWRSGKKRKCNGLEKCILYFEKFIHMFLGS